MLNRAPVTTCSPRPRGQTTPQRTRRRNPAPQPRGTTRVRIRRAVLRGLRAGRNRIDPGARGHRGHCRLTLGGSRGSRGVDRVDHRLPAERAGLPVRRSGFRDRVQEPRPALRCHGGCGAVGGLHPGGGRVHVRRGPVRGLSGAVVRGSAGFRGPRGYSGGRAAQPARAAIHGARLDRTHVRLCGGGAPAHRCGAGTAPDGHTGPSAVGGLPGAARRPHGRRAGGPGRGGAGAACVLLGCGGGDRCGDHHQFRALLP